MRWILADAVYSGASSQENFSELTRRINKAYKWPNNKGTNRFGTTRSSTGGNYYLMLTDTDYADLVSKSTGTTGLSSTEQANSVTTAPTGDVASSLLPTAIPFGLQEKVVPCIGDSITNGIVVTHAANEKLHAQLVKGNFPFYLVNGYPGRDVAYNRSLYWSCNYGVDSQQIANPTGDLDGGGVNPWGDWTTDSPKFLKYIQVASTQKLIFHIFMGTNDLAHNAGVDPVTEVYTNRLVPFINLLKTTYPGCLVVFAKVLARGPSSALNNRIISLNNQVAANFVSAGLAAVVDYSSVLGTGIWAGVRILDPANPGVTVAWSSAPTVTLGGSGVWTVGAQSPALITGIPITFFSTGTLPTGITASTAYYLRQISTTSFAAHNTLADAVAGTNTIVPTGGTGTITIATSGMTYYSTDGVHPKPAATALFGAASKAVIDVL